MIFGTGVKNPAPAPGFGNGPGATGPAGPAGATGAGGPGIGPTVNGGMSCADGGGAGAVQALVEGGSMLNGWVGQSDGGASFTQNQGTDGGTSPNRQLRMAKTTGAGKMLAMLPLTNIDSLVMQARTVTLLFDFRGFDGGGNEDIRGAILRMNNAVNDFPRPIVTAWNADGTDPTFDAAYTTAGGPLTFGSGANYSTGALTAGLPGINAPDHFALAFWTNNALAVGGELRLSDVSVQPGSSTTRPNQPQLGSEQEGCRQYIESSYDGGVNPGAVGDFNGALVMIGQDPVFVPYKTPKNFDPNAGPGSNPDNGITIFNPNSGASGSVRNTTAGADEAFSIIDGGTKGFIIQNTVANAGEVSRFHFVANGAL